jgi:hypothetical protein
LNSVEAKADLCKILLSLTAETQTWVFGCWGKGIFCKGFGCISATVFEISAFSNFQWIPVW